MSSSNRLLFAALCFAVGWIIYPPEPAADLPTATPPAAAADGCIESVPLIKVEGE